MNVQRVNVANKLAYSFIASLLDTIYQHLIVSNNSDIYDDVMQIDFVICIHLYYCVDSSEMASERRKDGSSVLFHIWSMRH